MNKKMCGWCLMFLISEIIIYSPTGSLIKVRSVSRNRLIIGYVCVIPLIIF